ncbi:MAG: tRNA uridine-5-carboxymethylaminomethyl(34) synthesis enzyme MnmG [Planctomycetia bacterium]
MKKYEILVVGGGHAGTEAALAAARMGASTGLVTSRLDTIAQMSCNPAIGGVAKGHIVREIDALGGAMGVAIDRTGIQFRMLNRRKGPAMHGPRAQADKQAYQNEIRRICEEQPDLELIEATVDDLLVEETVEDFERLRVIGVRTDAGEAILADIIILTTGTFMRGILHYGQRQVPGGREGEQAVVGISEALLRFGFELGRFKTGTPARIDKYTIDYDQLEIQPGDPDPEPFSFLHDKIECEQLPCHITYTNEKVHDIIRANLDQAPMYTGQIQSTGPRYCPSIETKIIRFADKERHQIFLEPEGRETDEVYINGLSTSMPESVQDEMIHAVKGLKNARIIRYGYAIEYDYFPPEQLRRTLETKRVERLYMAGQVNGTTGYEEAAGQGLIAAINAVLTLREQEPFILERNEAYLGVMIDDLITRSVDEPYRMFTSRAEHRLHLRQDNADRRLTAIGYRIGLVNRKRYNQVTEKEKLITETIERLEATKWDNMTLAKMLRRPEATWEDVTERLPELADLPAAVIRQVTYDIKYAGYMARQKLDIARQNRLMHRRIPENFDYHGVQHLRMEAKEQLSRVAPTDLAQASRISGITPADLAVLATALDQPKGEG